MQEQFQREFDNEDTNSLISTYVTISHLFVSDSFFFFFFFEANIFLGFNFL